MTKSKDSFVFYRSWFDGMGAMNDAEQAAFVRAVAGYCLDGEVPADDCPPVARAVFFAIKPQADRAAARYNANVENGKKGGRPSKKETFPDDDEPAPF